MENFFSKIAYIVKNTCLSRFDNLLENALRNSLVHGVMFYVFLLHNEHIRTYSYFLDFFLLNVLAFAQQDSIESKSYDIIYMKSGATLKGDILSFNEKEGSLVFRDIDNRVYSVSKRRIPLFQRKYFSYTFKRKRNKTPKIQ